jgi:hypothetical protein
MQATNRNESRRLRITSSWSGTNRKRVFTKMTYQKIEDIQILITAPLESIISVTI